MAAGRRSAFGSEFHCSSGISLLEEDKGSSIASVPASGLTLKFNLTFFFLSVISGNIWGNAWDDLTMVQSAKQVAFKVIYCSVVA